MRLLNETDPHERDAIRQEIVGYDQQIGTYIQLIDSDPDGRIHERVVEFQKNYQRYKQFRDEVISTDLPGAMTAAQEMAVSQVQQLAIGPADGFSDAARKSAIATLALGKMTLAHELARIVLLEQVYRAFTILKGHPYHTGH